MARRTDESSFSVRRASPGRALRALDKVCLGDAPPPRWEMSYWFGAYHRGRLVAYGAIAHYPRLKWEFTRAGVHPEFRKHGLHGMLIDARLDFAREIDATIPVKTHTLWDNCPSMRRLIDHGFRPVRGFQEAFLSYEYHFPKVRMR